MTTVSRTVRATIAGPSRLTVDHGFGVFVEREVLVDGGLPLVPALGGPLTLLFQTTRASRRVTKGAVVPGEPIYQYPAKIARVVDGDTLWVDVDLWDGLVYRALVRVDGVNCPESHGPKACPEGLAAAAYTGGLLPVGAPVVLTTRHVETRLLGHNERVEVHGRYLASVRLLDNDVRTLTERLIATGHGVEYHGEGKVS